MEPNVNSQKVGGEKPSLLGMITSPGLQFERMKNSNAVWGAFWLMTLLGGIMGALAAYLYSQDPASMAANKELGIEVPLAFTLGGGFLFSALVIILTFFIGAVVYKVLMMFMSNDTPYKKLLAITVYSSIISILGVIINMILAFILGGNGQEMYTGLGPLFASTGGVVYGVLKQFEIFAIWALVVTGLGLHITAGVSKKQATILVVVFFILTLGFGAIGGMFPKA
ncbi:YIP1 family protein [Bacillus sp. Xin]|uniref:Yip1 family protein n=1 Tax=unclassified Bacillus (in: firmicutes) TaxID=185979 RepID=UPI00157274B1|nr:MULTISPECIES: Yip1 family protein [unclassified Bacillus (in: firmicutes)]MBC6973870.1 YIP1 family protein [Bacillus sp. Xin]NSW36141.1 YIP1 family protein [Bacillus sp. Xin1]